ncbi:MAG: 2-oxo acid dehydrogenase subunit E2 [Deltaproteobacteria bacterium]|nr:2-oxo acid dehydrogenase subunit E2 [Deltaproteobacteria bacterium]
MSAFEFKLPDLGEGVTEGEIVEWHVALGDDVKEDDPMVEVMTDKATVTIGAPKDGTIADLKYAVGDVAGVGTVLVVIAIDGATAATAVGAPSPDAAMAPATVSAPAPAASAKSSDGPAATAVGDIKEAVPGANLFTAQAARTAIPANGASGSNGSNGSNGHAASSPAYFHERPLATPATRKLARDMSVDLRAVPPSGDKGRVTKGDIERFATSAGTVAAAGGLETVPTAPPRSAPAARRAPTARRSAAEEAALEDRKPFVGIRRKIAARMQATKNTAAHFTFVEECDVTRLIELRNRLKPRAAAEGIKLSYLPFIVKAVVASLKKHPALNSALDEAANELVTRRYYHVGIAAATPVGLMVPVLRNADQMNILDIAREIDRLGEGARGGTLSSDELSGSTFTITSLGKQGGLFATPILNHPEVGILGVHQMKQKPVVRDGEIVIGDVMLLSLSFDHRLVDGHIGAAFAYEIIHYLEDPASLLLELI